MIDQPPSNEHGFAIYFFGGFRQANLTNENRRVLHSITTGRLDETKFDFYRGEGDSLVSRSERAQIWLRDIATDFQVIVAAYSMGTHLALKFIDELRYRGGTVRDLVLFAPDPKYRECTSDFEDHHNGSRSAFDEAVELWQTPIPGRKFETSLTSAINDAGKMASIVYSRHDEVAEWHENVERIVIAIPDQCRIEGIFAGEQFHGSWSTIELLSSDTPSVHAQLFEIPLPSNRILSSQSETLVKTELDY